MEHTSLDNSALADGSLGRLADSVEQQHEQHRATMDALVQRRHFLKRAGIGGAVVAVGASATFAGVLSNAAAQSASSTPTLDDNDLGLVQFLQTIELAAVELYADAVDTRKLSASLAETARTFGQHHADYATALQTLAAKSALDRPNATLVASVSPAIALAGTSDAILAALFQLERGCAATYQLALASMGSAVVAGVLSTIQPVEGQMTATWGTVLGLPIEQWLPAFVSDAEAYQPSQYVS